ncbi:MAG: hypothetical protein COB38_10820 [Gammaproteobacteria bacterium]|nr:MAG: hypothetical protein COB38_10820 [Gammaproteobacteria bacterium]
MSFSRTSYFKRKTFSELSKNFFQKKVHLHLFVFMLFVANQAIAESKEQPSYERSLLNSCKTLSTNIKQMTDSLCKSYIHGFLAGAWGVRDVKIAKLKIKKIGSLTWTERAYLYRGNRLAQRITNKEVTYYCDQKDKMSVIIMEKLSTDLTLTTNTIASLNMRIYDVIKTTCPSDNFSEK